MAPRRRSTSATSVRPLSVLIVRCNGTCFPRGPPARSSYGVLPGQGLTGIPCGPGSPQIRISLWINFGPYSNHPASGSPKRRTEPARHGHCPPSVKPSPLPSRSRKMQIRPGVAPSGSPVHAGPPTVQWPITTKMAPVCQKATLPIRRALLWPRANPWTARVAVLQFREVAPRRWEMIPRSRVLHCMVPIPRREYCQPNSYVFACFSFFFPSFSSFFIFFLFLSFFPFFPFFFFPSKKRRGPPQVMSSVSAGSSPDDGPMPRPSSSACTPPVH